MSFIRGKIEADREVRPREITFGEVPWYQSPCGCWIDKVTNKKVETTVLTFEQIERMQATLKKSLFTRFLDWVDSLLPVHEDVKELHRQMDEFAKQPFPRRVNLQANERVDLPYLTLKVPKRKRKKSNRRKK